MKDTEKKVIAPEEETKKEVQTEENGVELTDEQLSKVTGGELVRGFSPKEVLVR